MIKDHYYPFRIDFAEYEFGEYNSFKIHHFTYFIDSRVKLYWNLTGTHQIITGDYLMYPVYVNNLLDVSVVCPTGFYGGIYPDVSQWQTLWGDGIQAGLEQWDDNNIQNNDGWSSTWAIEDGKILT